MFLTLQNLNDFLIPVIIYGIVISIFGTCTLMNYQQKKTQNNLLLLVGAILFIISDAFIALNSFYHPQKVYKILIIVLYALAQFLIVKSVIQRNQEL